MQIRSVRLTQLVPAMALSLSLGCGVAQDHVPAEPAARAPVLASGIIVSEVPTPPVAPRKGPGRGLTTTPFIAGGALTGSVIIGQLRSALNGILDHVRDIAADVATHLEQGLEASLAQLDQILGENVARPITELTGAMRLAVDRAIAVLDRVQATLTAITSCVGIDIEMVARTLDIALTSNVRDVAFWSGDRPFVAIGHVSGEGSRMGLYTGKATTTYKLRGVYPDLDTTCGAPRVWLVDGSERWSPVRVISADIREIAVEIPTLSTPGTRRIEIRYKDRGRRRCASDWRTVQSSVAVATEPLYQVDYSAQATCSVQRSQELVEWLHLENGSCDGDRSTSVQICPPSGSSYLSHSWEETSNNGCRSSTSLVGGGCVRQEATCPERGGIFCTGPGKWHHGRLHLSVARPEEVPASTPIEGRFAEGILPSSTRAVTIVDPHSYPVSGGDRTADCTWTVSASITHPSRRRTDIPSRSGRGPLVSSADGFSLQWNPNDGSVSVGTPPYVCEHF